MQDVRKNGPVEVRFMNGTPSSEYRLVVARDGTTSRTRTRAIGFGCGIRDCIEPVNSWAIYSSILKDVLNGCQICRR